MFVRHSRSLKLNMTRTEQEVCVLLKHSDNFVTKVGPRVQLTLGSKITS